MQGMNTARDFTIFFHWEREKCKIDAKVEGLSGKLSESITTPSYTSSKASSTVRFLEHKLELELEVEPFMPLIWWKLVSATRLSGPTELMTALSDKYMLLEAS